MNRYATQKDRLAVQKHVRPARLNTAKAKVFSYRIATRRNSDLMELRILWRPELGPGFETDRRVAAAVGAERLLYVGVWYLNRSRLPADSAVELHPAGELIHGPLFQL